MAQAESSGDIQGIRNSEMSVIHETHSPPPKNKHLTSTPNKKYVKHKGGQKLRVARGTTNVGNGSPGSSLRPPVPTTTGVYTISEEFTNIHESPASEASVTSEQGNRCFTDDSTNTSFSIISNGNGQQGSHTLDRTSSYSSGSHRVNVTLERSEHGIPEDDQGTPKEPSVFLCCSKEEAEDFQVDNESFAFMGSTFIGLFKCIFRLICVQEAGFAVIEGVVMPSGGSLSFYFVFLSAIRAI
jgi:hypothetical protein